MRSLVFGFRLVLIVCLLEALISRALAGIISFDTFDYNSYTNFSSSDGNAFQVFGAVVIAKGGPNTTASWYDGTGEGSIVWGRRNVYAASKIDNGNQFYIDTNTNGRLKFTSTSGSDVELTLTYQLSDAPGDGLLDLTGLDDLLLSYTSFDQDVDISLTLIDSNDITATGSYTPSISGPRFTLSTMTNWTQLDNTSIKQVQMGFTASGDGADIELDTTSFAPALLSSVPEPSGLAILLGLTGVLAACHRRIQRIAVTSARMESPVTGQRISANPQ